MKRTVWPILVSFVLMLFVAIPVFGGFKKNIPNVSSSVSSSPLNSSKNDAFSELSKESLESRAPALQVDVKTIQTDIVFDTPPRINVLPNGAFEWKVTLKNKGATQYNDLCMEVQNAVNNAWQTIKTTNPFILAPNIKTPMVIPFIPSGSHSRVVVKHQGNSICTSKKADYPKQDIQITSVYLTRITDKITCSVIMENKGSIPVAFGRLTVAKRSGAGWKPASGDYEFSSPLASGESRMLHFELDLGNSPELRVDALAKYAQSDTDWRYLDQAPVPVNANTIKDFYSNIQISSTLDQSRGGYVATIQVTNSNILDLEGLEVMGDLINPVSGKWLQKCSVMNPDRKSVV
jgi:hypothetical protein